MLTCGHRLHFDSSHWVLTLFLFPFFLSCCSVIIIFKVLKAFYLKLKHILRFFQRCHKFKSKKSYGSQKADASRLWFVLWNHLICGVLGVLHRPSQPAGRPTAPQEASFCQKCSLWLYFPIAPKCLTVYSKFCLYSMLIIFDNI